MGSRFGGAFKGGPRGVAPAPRGAGATRPPPWAGLEGAVGPRGEPLRPSPANHLPRQPPPPPHGGGRDWLSGGVWGRVDGRDRVGRGGPAPAGKGWGWVGRVRGRGGDRGAGAAEGVLDAQRAGVRAARSDSVAQTAHGGPLRRRPPAGSSGRAATARPGFGAPRAGHGDPAGRMPRVRGCGVAAAARHARRAVRGVQGRARATGNGQRATGNGPRGRPGFRGGGQARRPRQGPRQARSGSGMEACGRHAATAEQQSRQESIKSAGLHAGRGRTQKRPLAPRVHGGPVSAARGLPRGGIRGSGRSKPPGER